MRARVDRSSGRDRTCRPDDGIARAACVNWLSFAASLWGQRLVGAEEFLHLFGLKRLRACLRFRPLRANPSLFVSPGRSIEGFPGSP